MDNIIFSLNNFVFFKDNTTTEINKNKYITIQDCTLNVHDNLCPQNSIIVDTKNTSFCNMCRSTEINNSRYIELIHCGENQLKNKFITNNCEINIFQNHISVIYKTNIYCYYYEYYENNFVYEIENKLYVFNNNYFLVFDFIYKVFSHFYIEKINNNKNQIICRLPKNLNYFILFSFNLKTNKVTTKKLKKAEDNFSYLLPFKLFYLCKHNFEDVKNIIDDSFKTNELFDYFNKFENIFCFNDNYYITSLSKTSLLKLTINNNRIIDID